MLASEAYGSSYSHGRGTTQQLLSGNSYGDDTSPQPLSESPREEETAQQTLSGSRRSESQALSTADSDPSSLMPGLGGYDRLMGGLAFAMTPIAEVRRSCACKLTALWIYVGPLNESV